MAPLWAAMLALSGFWQKLWMIAVDEGSGVDQSRRSIVVVRPAMVVQRLRVHASPASQGPASRPTQPRKRESRWHAIHSYFLNVTHQPVQSLDPLGQKDWNWGSGGDMVINW